jgi:lipopolysaccharide export system permease protein
LKSYARGGTSLGRTGVWLKEHHATDDGDRSYSVHVSSTGPSGELLGIKIYEFDARGLMTRTIAAESGVVEGTSLWKLSNARITQWLAANSLQPAVMSNETHREWLWNGGLSAEVVSAALLPVDSMSTFELWRYIAHLDTNAQAIQAYEIQFWKRAFYPFACLVMVGLALPFAYLHARSGGISLKVFGGIMLGISFILLNSLSGHLGLLKNWTPWLVAAAPGVLFLMMSMLAFAWLVRFR